MTASILAMTLLAAVASSASATPPRCALDHQRLYLRSLNIMRRQIETRLQDVADPGLALIGTPLVIRSWDVAIDRALRHLQRIAEIARPHQVLAAHELNDLEQSVGPAHVALTRFQCG